MQRLCTITTNTPSNFYFMFLKMLASTDKISQKFHS